MPKNPHRNESKQDFLRRCSRELIDSEGMESDQAFSACNLSWDESRVKAAKPITLSAELRIDAAKKDDESSQCMLTAYTGQVIDMGWFGRYVFSLDGMKAKAKIPILREHKRDRVVGYSKKAWVENGNFYVAGEFSKSTRDAKEVLALANEGYPWQVSVGISPTKIKTLDKKESMVVNGQELSGPIEVWIESKVGEVSFVSLGADDDTAAIALHEQPMIDPPVEEPRKEIKMNLEDLKAKHPELFQEVFAAGAASIDMEPARQEGIQAERGRVTKIMEADAGKDMTLKAITDGVSIETAGWMFFEAEKFNRTQKLETMKDSIPEPVGHGAVETSKSNQNDFVKMRDAYQKEHKCGLGSATSAVAKQYPEIHQAWLDGQVN